MPSKPTDPIYQLKVTLRRTSPPIWRRILVPGSATLQELHQVIQVAMGWQGGHLHEFFIGRENYGTPTPGDRERGLDERRYPLKKLLPAEKSRFSYVYDFGDSWDHDILIEKILPRQADAIYPSCITGRRACPPEDVGGIWGYRHFLEAISDPNHPGHDEMLEWWGDEFDPEAFSAEKVNQRLQGMRFPAR